MTEHTANERIAAAPGSPVTAEARAALLKVVALERARKLEPFQQSLAGAGVIETYDRATGRRHADPRIFDVAFEHLARSGYDDETRGTIARSFETRGAATHWTRIKELYIAARGPDESDALAASLATCARSVHVGDLKDLVTSAQNGLSRILLLRPIARLDRAGGRDFVLAFSDDPDLHVEVDRIRRRRAPND